MYVPAKLMTLRELLLCELFLLLIPMAAYPIREIFHIEKDRRKGQRSTALVCSAIDVLQTLVIALGGGLCVWGGINLLEGYGQDNPAANAHVR